MRCKNDNGFVSSHGGEGGHVADTASVSSGESDVSLFSPSISPRVLDDPAAVGSSGKGDTVVEGSFAVVEDTRFVG